MATVAESYEAHTKAIDAAGKMVSATIIYIVSDAVDEDDALYQTLQVAAKELDGVPLKSIEIQSKDNDSTFHVTANYEKESSAGGSGGSSSGSDADEEQTVSFDCSGGTKHVNHAIAQRRVYGVIDAGSAIGWNGVSGDGMEVSGCDIATGQLRETYEKIMRMGDITTSKKRTWNSLVGKVNKQSFKGWNPGEVMFLGCSFSGVDNNRTKVKVQFSFSIQENERNAVIDGINCGYKKGFDYIWVISSTENNANGQPSAKVKAIYIAQVCGVGDFTKLGI